MKKRTKRFSQKIFNINLIGEVLVKKNRRSKRLSLSIKPDLSVVVTIPFWCSYSAGKEFAESKEKWINKHLKRIREKNKSIQIFDENTNYKIRNYSLKIIRENCNKISVIIEKPVLKIIVPVSTAIEEKPIQDKIKEGIIDVLRIESKKYIPERVDFFSRKYNFSYNRLFFKNIKTRWGSCSSKNNINFNIHLMKLPERLIDYVILHELTHTVHKNHSKKFWNALEKNLPNYKELDKELKQYSSQIYL